MNKTGVSSRLELLSQLCLDYNQIVADVKNSDRKRRVYENKELGLSFFSSNELLNRDIRARIEEQLSAKIGELASLLRYRNFNNFGCLQFLGDLYRKTSQDGNTPHLNAGFVAYEKSSKQVVVVLLGSLKPSDYWLYNGNLRRTSALEVWGDRISVLPSGLEGLELHRGYASLALELSIQVDSILADTIGVHENKIASYLYSGHSLGAAAAGQMQILKEIESFQNGLSLTTYGLLFAQPRSIVVVDKQGYKNDILETGFMRSLATRTLDFVFAKDVVPIASEMLPASFIGRERNGAKSMSLKTTVANFRRQCGQSAFGALGTRWEAGTGDGLLNLPSPTRHFAKVYMKEVTKAIHFEVDNCDDDRAEEMEWTPTMTAKHVDNTETWKWWARRGLGEEVGDNSDSDETATPLSSDGLSEDCVVTAPRKLGRATLSDSDELYLPFLSDCEDSVSEGCVAVAPREFVRKTHSI
jgi:hypothetical protein